MGLSEEIEKRRTEVKTESYPMSIGELASIYEKGELNLHPQFQRFFRWSDKQKTSLIESILLGIPIPSIFLSQKRNGKWDVIDGVQRLSTIFETMGILRDKDDKIKPTLVLEATRYLPALKGKHWQEITDNETEETISSDPARLSAEAQLLIKRSKLDLKIVLRESSESSKYELFQRLNTGGAATSDQEVRNCVVIMVSPEFYDWTESLANDLHFRSCVSLTERALEERYDLELVTRFLTLRNITNEEMKDIDELKVFLDDKIVRLASDPKFDRGAAEHDFRATFERLDSVVSDDSFRRYNKAQSKFSGGFSVSAFEVISIGIGYHIGSKKWNLSDKAITDRIKNLWGNKTFLDGTGSGVRASSRIPVTLPLGRSLFGN